MPQILDGVPLRLQRVTVDIDRPGFMFNPTNCDAAADHGASISGSENAKANVSSPFAVGGCKSLAFKPKFTVSTAGKTSKADGASLDAKVSYPAGSVGSEANIARVKVDLPKQLPSRLTTLQKACTAAKFEANPADCPAASIVGHRQGDHAAAAGRRCRARCTSSPTAAKRSRRLIVVLQGDGVRVDLTGSTFISKAGITSQHVQDRARRPRQHVRAVPPRGPVLRAHSRHQPLRGHDNDHDQAQDHKESARPHHPPNHHHAHHKAREPDDAKRIRRAERHRLKQNTKVEVTGCTTSKTKPKPKQKTKPKRAGDKRGAKS